MKNRWVIVSETMTGFLQYIQLGDGVRSCVFSKAGTCPECRFMAQPTFKCQGNEVLKKSNIYL
jgi:hypothetical protein